jgi:hypothetical protein
MMLAQPPAPDSTGLLFPFWQAPALGPSMPCPHSSPPTVSLPSGELGDSPLPTSPAREG